MLRWSIAVAGLAMVLTATPGCSSNPETTAAKTPASNPASVAANPNIEARADAALQRMSRTLAAASSFKLHSTATMEERLESGQLAHFSRDSVVIVGRPDRMWAEIHRGAETRRIWHQGKDLTILDVRQNLYSTLQTPGRIDEMLDNLAEEHGIVVPLDDLLYPNPYQVLTEHVKSGVFVDQQEISGHLCDHLLFTQDNVDWQIWIDTASPAVPRRVVITEKTDPDQPQYEAVLDGWELNVPLSATQFTPQVPASAARVEIAELVDSD